MRNAQCLDLCSTSVVGIDNNICVCVFLSLINSMCLDTAASFASHTGSKRKSLFICHLQL